MKSRKLPMEKRQSPKELSVTFTKRRQGLFSKAAELSAFCDAQIAVLVSSPSKRKIYSFGHSSVPSVLRSFLYDSRPVPNPIPDYLISAGDGDNSTKEDALSALDDFQNSDSVEELSFLVEELGKLVDRAKRNPKYGCRTSNSAPVAGNFGNFVFSGEGNYYCGTSNSDLQGLLLCQSGPILGHDLNWQSAAGKFGKLVEELGKRKPNYECGTSKSDLQGFFLTRNYVPVCDQFSGDLVSAGGGSDSTETQALSVADDSGKRELSCLVQAIAGNSNYNYGTSNSDHPSSGSDFNGNGTFNTANCLFGTLQESSFLVSGNYSTISASDQLMDPLGSAESNNCAVNVGFWNPYATEESRKSIMEEEKRWSFKEDDNGLLVPNDYKIAMLHSLIVDRLLHDCVGLYSPGN